ncbi:fumarylacetoacetate hydrolase family protein [Mumia sp. zg.B53]|uniref:fumarylacetoacetate hydrolase family protein n=1 Tax=unclassified Mumia TaxID=2621872 RepID=UPI001C6DEA24|nr:MULTISPECIES: fumarylacetoacetate hydrolase family protein [unclassified Mumia]MBW9206421.1 fumarylacetoacetate hydrolase family protein [Mumia sp. zg.B17]MBW9211289.1 fumarylacetoacetate hydrolase family protein [Mumia sp. zg.B21]MBW9215864.1 fumarylacetoacetate hydrolase family protein [Mumia sp. zg.B53]MDD9348570.1 fumarylacetoacetate hydrolase family protein [Mumia sp.]
MRIARFTTDEDPRFGVVGEADGVSVIAVITGDPLYAGIQLTGERIPLDDVRLLAPVLPRSKVVGIGRNYAAHAAELGNEVPDEPLVFFKPNTSVTGPGDPILYPSFTELLSYEGELAVVIGRICKDVPAEDAARVIHGYTVANDVTARDRQKTDGQWSRAKGADGFCPLGPWIETDLDPSDLRLTTTVNGEVVQDGRTSDMVHKIPDLIAYTSSFMTLLPGDVILTGTPEGVGPMNPGDEVSITVEGLGTLTNKVVSRD